MTSAAEADDARANRTGIPCVDHRRNVAHTAFTIAGSHPMVVSAETMNTRTGLSGRRSQRARTGRTTVVTSAAAAGEGAAGFAAAVTPTSVTAR